MPMRPEYYVRSGSMYENPWGVPHEEIDRMVRENPPEVVAQVVFGKFVESSGLVFTAELINQFFDRSVPKVMADFWVDEARTRQGRLDQSNKLDPYRYSIGVDLARKKDYTVIFVIDLRAHPHRVVYYRRLNRVPWDTIYAEIGRACAWYSGYELFVDATGSGGDVVMDALLSHWYCPAHHVVYPMNGRCSQHGRPAPGWELEGGNCFVKRVRIDAQEYIFTAKGKADLINHLQDVFSDGYDASRPELEFGLLRCPVIHHLQEELTEYAWEDKKLQTDCVFGLALAAQGIRGLVPSISFGGVLGG